MGKGSGSGAGAIVRHVPATPVATPRTVHRHSPRASPTSGSGPKGLQNVGNSCYANAALHCLLSTALTNALLDPTAATLFRRYSSNPNILSQGSGSVDSEDEGNNSNASSRRNKVSSRQQRRREQDDRKMQENCEWLTQELRRLTREYHQDTPRSRSHSTSWFSFSTDQVINPGSITKHPNRLSRCLTPYQQEDAHEFLRALLSTLVMNGHNKHLSSLFDGLLESSVTCTTCRRPSLTRDRYMDLSLDISGSQTETLTDALYEFTKTETLTGDNKVHCQKCRTKRTATKGLRLATAPSILVCHLKRFAYDETGQLVRLRKKVRFSERLEIGNFMSRVNKARPPPYDLVAVLVHQGQSCDSGHYLSYVKNNGKWFMCNDSVVKEVDIDTVLNQQAYVLIYEVAEMRENTGFNCPSPGRSMRSKSSWRDEKPTDSPFNLSSYLCGLDQSLLGDFCCNPATPRKVPQPVVFQDDYYANVSYETRLSGGSTRRHELAHDDLSTLGESTVESTDSPTPLHRSSSSGKLLDKGYTRHMSEPRTFQREELSTPSTKLTTPKKSNIGVLSKEIQRVNLARGSSSGQIFEATKDMADLNANCSTSDPGADPESDNKEAAKKTWKEVRNARPMSRESSLPRHESYRRPPPSPNRSRRPDP